MSGSARAEVVIDNERVIVTRFDFRPGDNTGWHRHERDYVIVPVVDGKVRLETPEGEAAAKMQAGVPYFRQAGVEHDVINAGDGALAFVEIELK